MDDTLANIVQRQIVDAGLPAIAGEQGHLRACLRIRNLTASISSRDRMISNGQVRRRPPRLSPRSPKARERLRARHFVEQHAVDIQQVHIASGCNDVRRPKLVIERGHHA